MLSNRSNIKKKVSKISDRRKGIKKERKKERNQLRRRPEGERLEKIRG